jgi:hypothetical protein
MFADGVYVSNKLAAGPVRTTALGPAFRCAGVPLADQRLPVMANPRKVATLADGVGRPLCRIANPAVEVPATAIAVHSGKSLWSTLAIVAMVFQLRVVAVTP